MKNGCYTLFILSLLCCSMPSKVKAQITDKVNSIPQVMDLYHFYLTNEQGKRVGEIQFKIYAPRRKPTEDISDNRIAHIDYIYVNKTERSNGNGQHLLEAALNRIAASDCTRIEVRVDGNNKHSLHLFEKNGFEKAQVTKHPFGESYLLHKKLTGQETKAVR